jgi:hypothetical protein
VLRKRIQPAFEKLGINGVGWHTFRHTVGTMLAEMGEHELTIRDYLRHSNLHVTNSTCRRLRARSARRRTSWSTPFCRRGCCPKVTWFSENQEGEGTKPERRVRRGKSSGLLLFPNVPTLVFGRPGKCFEIWRGRRDSNSRPLP